MKQLFFLIVMFVSTLVVGQIQFNFNTVDCYNQSKKTEEFKLTNVIKDNISITLYDNHIQVCLQNYHMIGYYTVIEVKTDRSTNQLIMKTIGECHLKEITFVFDPIGDIFIFGVNDKNLTYCNHYRNKN